jgi:hypothetical protein
MNKIKELMENIFLEIIENTSEREAISKIIETERKFGSSGTVDVSDKYEKIIEELIK